MRLSKMFIWNLPAFVVYVLDETLFLYCNIGLHMNGKDWTKSLNVDDLPN